MPDKMRTGRGPPAYHFFVPNRLILRRPSRRLPLARSRTRTARIDTGPSASAEDCARVRVLVWQLGPVTVPVTGAVNRIALVRRFKKTGHGVYRLLPAAPETGALF